MKITFKIIISLVVFGAYFAFLNTFGVELGLDAAMQQMENVELSYSPSAFMRAVNNYGWIAIAAFNLLLFNKEILLLVNKIKKNTIQEENS